MIMKQGKSYCVMLLLLLQSMVKLVFDVIGWHRPIILQHHIVIYVPYLLHYNSFPTK